jgi:hypothetical protein
MRNPILDLSTLLHRDLMSRLLALRPSTRIPGSGTVRAAAWNADQQAAEAGATTGGGSGLDFENVVVVATYSDHPTAEAAASLLGSEGIDAIVQSDDAGGELPNLDVGRAIRVYVQRENEEFARQLLGVDSPG